MKAVPFWRDAKKRSFAVQSLALIVILVLASVIVNNTAASLKNQGVAAGFGFLGQEAAFAIGDTPISYSSEDSFAKALTVGLVNTLIVALVGNVLAVVWGTLLGIARLSSNWPLATMARLYVDILRNIPLLLQLFFWYALITEILPPVREAIEILPHVFLSQRGMALPLPLSGSLYNTMAASCALGLLLTGIAWSYGKKIQNRTGSIPRPLKWAPLLPCLLPLLIWTLGGWPVNIETPALKGFNFQGGMVLSPEFFALLMGLVSYTSAFVAEIVRSGIKAVPKGQWEASEALGLSSLQVLSLVILPQALRVIIPPLTSQMLNLTKNSSLAVAIGYPDLVNVANTTSNQTGQAVECIAIIMAVYLSFSLLTSLFMNWYNHTTKLITK